MKEEQELLKRIGRHEPFVTPEGYFESLTERVMNRLPEKEVPAEAEYTLWQRIKPWIYMTALFAGLMCSMRIWMEHPEEHPVPTLTESDAALFTDEEMELITDRSMMDDYSLYEYLRNESEEELKSE